MIHPDSTFEIKKIPLYLINVFEYQPRYMNQLERYVTLRREPRYEGWCPGFLAVSPAGDRYDLLDGHHRFVAYIMTGRAEAMHRYLRAFIRDAY